VEIYVQIALIFIFFWFSIDMHWFYRYRSFKRNSLWSHKI